MINFKHEFLVMIIFLSITAVGIVQNKDTTKNILDNNNFTDQYNDININNTNITDQKAEMTEEEKEKEARKKEKAREKEAKKRIEKLYNKSISLENIVVYVFNTGEIVELNTSSIINLSEMTNGTNKNSSIEPGGLRYITKDLNDADIKFMGDKYEKILPNITNLLFPIIFEVKNKTLNESENFNLRSNYSIMVEDSNYENQSVKIGIKKNNVTLREFKTDNETIFGDNRTIEWWEYLNNNPKDYKKRKVISIKFLKINDTEIVADMAQYGNKRTITLGNAYREFRVTNITEDSIIMENVEYVRLDKYRKFSIGRLTLYI